MQGAEMLVPILVPLGAFAMVFGIVYLISRENLAMIEKGMNPKDKKNRPAPFRSLKTGLLFLGAGIGLFLSFMLDNYVLPNSYNPAFLYFALLGIGGGIGLVISYSIEKRHWVDKQENDL